VVGPLVVGEVQEGVKGALELREPVKVRRRNSRRQGSWRIVPGRRSAKPSVQAGRGASRGWARCRAAGRSHGRRLGTRSRHR